MRSHTRSTERVCPGMMWVYEVGGWKRFRDEKCALGSRIVSTVTIQSIATKKYIIFVMYRVYYYCCCLLFIATITAAAVFFIYFYYYSFHSRYMHTPPSYLVSALRWRSPIVFFFFYGFSQIYFYMHNIQRYLCTRQPYSNKVGSAPRPHNNI